MKSLTAIVPPKVWKRRNVIPTFKKQPVFAAQVPSRILVRCRVLPPILVSNPNFFDLDMPSKYNPNFSVILAKRYTQLKNLKN